MQHGDKSRNGPCTFVAVPQNDMLLYTMSSDEGTLVYRLEKLKERLNETKTRLDRTVTDPQSDESDIRKMMSQLEDVAAEINTLERERETAARLILEALKESDVIQKYARVGNVVQLRIGSVELALGHDQLLIFLSGLVRGGQRAQEIGADLSDLRIEDYISTG